VKKVVAVVIIAFLAQYAWNDLNLAEKADLSSSNTDSVIAKAFDNHQNNLQVKGVGEVLRVLSDDRDGSRHQRFLLRLDSGQTLLVAHNIDLAPRITSLAAGDTVEFFGEYEWNSKGGVIHWTHHDPQGAHVSGWLKHQGRTYK
jgi:molybdopterin converting factor small subunit